MVDPFRLFSFLRMYTEMHPQSTSSREKRRILVARTYTGNRSAPCCPATSSESTCSAGPAPRWRAWCHPVVLWSVFIKMSVYYECLWCIQPISDTIQGTYVRNRCSYPSVWRAKKHALRSFTTCNWTKSYMIQWQGNGNMPTHIWKGW